MTQPVVEKAALLESTENDAEFLKAVIQIFLNSCPGTLEEIRGGVAACDSTRVMSASHALRGSISFFGAKIAVEAVRALEFMGKQGNLEGANEALRVLEREIAVVMTALDEIAKEIE